MGRLLTVFLCVVPMLLLTVWQTEQISVGPMEVRLVDGDTRREGRLEVRKDNGTWGTVCNNSWTTEASNVVCKQLGLEEPGQAVSVTRYGEGTGSIWLDDVNCTGSESNLGQCSSLPWGDHNCSHNEDVGIVCYEFPVRPFNGSANWGPVEVRHRGVWGLVCEDGNWTYAVARVVCKELGFSGGGVRFGGPETDQLHDIVWLNNLNCTGNETSLEQCVVQPWGQTGNCQRPAHVLCYSTSAPEVRLAGGGSSYGRVEILMDGQTYSVCDNDWDEYDATAVCRLLGYQSGQPTLRSYYGAGRGQVALDRVACERSDTSLLTCRSSGWLETEAACGDHSKDAGAICFSEVQLVRGDHSTGILLLNINMHTYAVCHFSFSNNLAAAACRELGFEHGRALPQGAYGSYDGSYTRIGLICLKNETRISSCFFPPFSCHGDTRYNYASVHCFNGSLSSDLSVSLDAGQGLIGNSSGRLVVSQSGVRGRVCPEYWDDIDAGVVCRQLGYRDGMALAFSDSGTGPYLVGNVACTGVETSIFNCLSNTTCIFSYQNPPDVGAVCFTNYTMVVQLVGGRSDKEGLVQVVYGSQVGTVCVPDTSNRATAARVVCRQLGYVDGEFERLARGTGTVSISDVNCSGYEGTVFMCGSGGLFFPPSDRCANHDFDLGVRCSDGVRLAYRIHNTNISITGVVQIYQGSDWINICNDFFDDLDAQVVCRNQGYPYSRVLPRGSMGSPFEYDFVTAQNCNGTEQTLLDCPVQQNVTCSWQLIDRYATVFCSQTSLERGLQAAPMSADGHVVVMADGVKSYVCRDNWDDATASVYCKDLGYNYGVAIYQNGVSIYETGVSTSRYVAAYIVNSVHCTGSENSLSECSFSSNWSTCLTGYNSAAQALCYYGSGRQLQLTGGTTNKVGQVEVGFNGVWGTVCDNDFTNDDATAVCLTLGFSGGATSDNSTSSDQSPTGPFYLYGLSCRGSETSLWRCPVSNFNVSYSFCSSPSYIPRVRCTGQVKLVENADYGAVQVLVDTTSRTYGLVCDDNFTDREASVACRDLGYPYGIHLCCSAFGYKSLPIVRSGVRCTGTEALFSDCYYDTRTAYCLTGNYASIVCSSIPPGRGYTVQIDTASRGPYGRVKVQHMGYWGFVCPSGFDRSDANVICREAGYTGGWAVVDNSNYDSSTLRWLSNIDCDGSESHLSRCWNLIWGNVSDCGNTGFAAVYCTTETDTQLRLVNGTQTTGRVEVSMDQGNSGSICSEGWTDVEAAVACKSMGFKSGRFLGAGTYGQGVSYLLLTRVNCSRVASSQTLLDCNLSLTGLGYTTCSYSNYGPGVQCFDKPVRLTGTRQENYGRVEVYINDNWTAVCDQGFDQTAAHVACRSLGFSYALHQCCSALGLLGRGPVDARQIGFKVNACGGDEVTLMNCTVSTPAACPSGKYASVLCSNTSLQEQTLTVRLAGPGGNYGRVEVNRYGLWGPVCNSNWDDRDANATCRGLGYSHGVTFYGNDAPETPILVGDFQCSGHESSLAGCSFKDSSDEVSCLERKVVAGVLCSRNAAIKLRLTDGGRNYGRLEVLYEGQWGRVIGSFSDTNADVACRHLGFLGGQTAPEYMRRDTVTGHIWMSDVYCKGYEQSLFECLNRWNSSAGGGEDQYAICYNTTRIKSGNSFSMGEVQIYYNKRWGAICDVGWSEEDTAVACRDLGYDNGYHLCCSPFGRDSRPIAENFQCTGREQTLTNCSHTAPESNYYCTKDVVSVACYNGPPPSDYTFSLDGGNTVSSGEVQVTFMNITGSICSDNWDDTDARVFCRELGFQTGHAFKHWLLADRPFWMTDVHCTGSERFLKDCPKTLGAVSQCSTQLPAGATCSDIEGVNYRLAGSNSSYKGPVEVQVNGTWGTVCGAFFDARWAKVFCRMHGFTRGSTYFLGRYSGPPNKSFRNAFRCNGDESVLDECPQLGWKPMDSSDTWICGIFVVSVTCFGDVRIGKTNHQGPVQFYKNGTWYNLCDTDFDDVTARQVCQDLSYVDGRAVCCSAYGVSSYHINSYETNLNYTMRCQGTESDSTDCLRPGVCLSGNYASVVCFNSTDVVDEGYTFGFQDNTKTSGQVVVTHLGVAGRICNTFWDDVDARVLCRSRGHQDGAAYHYSQYNYEYQLPSERGPYWLSGINCTGSEASLGDCPFNDWLHLGNCSTADLAGAVCFNDTGIQYRLVGGDREGAGRVEISVGGLWGTVCDYNWNDKDASVLCRSLNYTDGYAVSDAYYGQGAGPIWLSNGECKGSERSLVECPFSRFTNEFAQYPFSTCTTHRHDASAVCIDNIKLNFGFNASMGAVMVYLGKAWTLICDEDFDTNSAVTACRSLGFPHGLQVPGGDFGRVDAAIGITHVRCTGREPGLLDCSYNITTSCSSRSYASVVCSREPFVETSAKVRIIEDTMSEPHHGLINVQVEGVWGAVCAAGFGVTEATVTCKGLGFAGGVPYTAHFPDRKVLSQTTLQPILMSDVKCRGDEKTLINCQYTTTSTTSWCDYYAPRAGVLCYNDTNGISYRLVGDTDPSRGRVEMRYGGEWGLVCLQDGLSRAGGPACRSLGFRGGLTVSPYRFDVPSSDLFWFYQLNCQGNESSLPLCTSTGFNNSNEYYYKVSCINDRTLHVECFSKDTVITNLRLAGSTSNSSGRVEVFLQGPDQWGTVCDYNWDDFDATVVCNQLGYATGKAVNNAAFGQGQGRIWLDSVGCLGTERRLQDCAFRSFGDNTCRHYEDAGVICSGVYIPPTSVSHTVISIVTYTTVSQESLETSSVQDPTQSLLTPTHSGAYIAAIVVPVLIVAIVTAIIIAAIIYGKNVERFVPERETRPGLMSLGAGGFISHVRDKLKRKNGRGGVNQGTDLSENSVYYDPGLTKPVYDISVVPDKSAEDDV